MKKIKYDNFVFARLGRAEWPRWQTLGWQEMCTLTKLTGNEARENVNCFVFSSVFQFSPTSHLFHSISKKQRQLLNNNHLSSFSSNLLLLTRHLISPSVLSANKVDGPRVNEGLPLHIKVRCLGFWGEPFHLLSQSKFLKLLNTNPVFFFQRNFWAVLIPLPPGVDVGVGNTRQLSLPRSDAREVR